jgi:hydrogenase large subunit
VDGNLSEILPVDLRDPEQIQEHVAHSWYQYPEGTQSLHPFAGVTDPKFALGPKTQGSKTRIEALDEGAKYSWIKAPRWRGHAMEVGPLARWVVGYAKGLPEFKEPVDHVLKTLDLPISALFSTLGRTAARGLECQWAVYKLKHFQDKLLTHLKQGDFETANTTRWEPKTWPTKAQGVGFTEAPRGALGHWIQIDAGKIANYQAIVPTTWNGSPRDDVGKIGAFEASLLDTPMADPEKPLEILRTLHSFDPCLACSTHVVGPSGEPLTRVQVR